MKNKIWLSSPHMGGSEQKYVQEAFDTNWVAPLGPNVNEFENSLENYLNEDSHVAALSSGTAAIHLALILLGISIGKLMGLLLLVLIPFWPVSIPVRLSERSFIK